MTYQLLSVNKKIPNDHYPIIAYKGFNVISNLENEDLSLLYNKHLIIPVKLTYNNKTISTSAMIDSGATGSFIDIKFIKKNKFPLFLRTYQYNLM